MTQGLVSIRKDGKVVMKIVAGNDGMNAKALADKIKHLGVVPTPTIAMVMARQCGFGSTNTLVVVEKSATHYDGDGEPGPLYLETFHLPNFNPRWEQGTADFTEIVDL